MRSADTDRSILALYFNLQLFKYAVKKQGCPSVKTWARNQTLQSSERENEQGTYETNQAIRKTKTGRLMQWSQQNPKMTLQMSLVI